MKWLILLLFCLPVHATVKVAIIDTGLDIEQYPAKLCESGHRDFTGTGLADTNGHGTNIAGIISQAKGDYCLVILKYFNNNEPADNLNREIAAINYATSLGVSIINMSGGGYFRDKNEGAAVKAFLDTGGTFVSAAGNNHNNIDVQKFFPASSNSRVIVVGSTAKSSNYGRRVNCVIPGSNIEGNGYVMSGTSQSTALFTRDHLDTLTLNKRKLYVGMSF